jgi:putative pyruvate formate lyase activating enzyme
MLIRHLVLPEGLAGTREIMRFLANEVSKDTYVNVMSQYRPCGEAHKFPELRRSITAGEFREAISMAQEEGIHRLDERKLIQLFKWL